MHFLDPAPAAALLAFGGLLLATSLAAPRLAQLPVSTAMVYLGVGAACGPWGLGWIAIDLRRDAALLERLAELGLLASLFVTGLKIGSSLAPRRWGAAVTLASATMVVSIAALAGLAVALLHLAWPEALLLGAVLAPTDPVLASDVQVRHAEDRDALRFSLSGEAGLNDGTAFPFVLLGLGLLGLHGLGEHGVHWLLVDVLWGVAAGLGVGALAGWSVGVLARRVHGPRDDPVQLNEFIAIGTIALAYGTAQPLGGYGFLAVFMAGLTLRRALVHAPLGRGGTVQPADDKMRSVLHFNTQLERIGELVLVVLVGAALAHVEASWELAGFVAAGLLLVRPVAVWLTVPSALARPRQRALMGWFGIRGIGSMYYLAYVLERGAEGAWTGALASATLAAVAASIVLHGVSVTPLMASYERRQARRQVPDEER